MTSAIPTDSPQSKTSRTALIFLALALILGGALRALPIFLHPFVSNDGGLFWAMVRAIEANNFALPARVFYPTDNTPNLPFCYPPLGFYVAALLEKLGLPLTVVFRWLPWLWSMATIGAFWRLARIFCADKPQGEWAAGAATLSWCLLPWGFVWNVMGGGLTRAPGLLWALLAIATALELWREEAPDKASWKRWLWLMIWLALGFLTHLERASFAVLSVGVVWLFYGRSWRGLGQLASALLGAAVLSAPWWGLCLARFGLEPFRAAAASGGSDWQTGSGSGLEKLVSAAIIALSGESLIPAFHVVALLGILWLLWRRQWFLPVWVALILLLEVRSGRTFVVAPLALSFGLLLSQWPRGRNGIVVAVTLWLCFLSSAFQSRMAALSLDDLAAMRWAKANTPAGARFLVMPTNHWAADAPSEWFPALTQRASVSTVQGAEWLPNREFARRVQRHDKLRKRRSWRAVQASSDLPAFDWIWRPDDSKTWQPNADWRKVWARGDNEIWHRVK